MSKRLILSVAGILLVAAAVVMAEKMAGGSGKKATTRWAPAVDPKPLSSNVEAGLAWLAKHQYKSGGWAQGEESARMGRGMDKIKDKPNVGDTCAATLALLRAGNTPKKGKYSNNVLRGVKFVCAQVEESDKDSLWVTDVRGTRLQAKLGTYIDTFMAAMLLAEVADKMPDEKSQKRVAAALDKIMMKMKKNQKADGTFGNKGWAPTLARGLASKAMNRAAQTGAKVDEKMRAKAEENARKGYDKKTGKFKPAGSAGVQ